MDEEAGEAGRVSAPNEEETIVSSAPHPQPPQQGLWREDTEDEASFAEESDEVPFDELPPKERIQFLIDLLSNQKSVYKVSLGSSSAIYSAEAMAEHDERNREFAEGIAEKFSGALCEQPSLALDSFCAERKAPSLPLIHLVCRLDFGFGLPIVKAVHSVAGPESLKRCVPYGGDDSDPEELPLHRACWNGASIELIEFLVAQYPESVRLPCNDKLPLQIALTHSEPQAIVGQEQDPFDENSRRMALFRILSPSLSKDELLRATRELDLSWKGCGCMPLGLIQKVADLHGSVSLKVKTSGLGVGCGCTVEIDGDVLTCTVFCDRTYDFALEQLLSLPLPLKEIEADYLDYTHMAPYLINALDPWQNYNRAEEEAFAAKFNAMLSIARPITPREPPPPLDLTAVEVFRFDAVIKDEEVMIGLMKSLRQMPNLKEFYLSGLVHRSEGDAEGCGDFPLTEKCFDELLKVVSITGKLKTIELSWVCGAVLPSFVDFLLSYDRVESVSFMAPDPISSCQMNHVARFLRSSTTVKSMKLIPMKEGEEEKCIVDAIKDNGSVLEIFTAEGEYDIWRRERPKLDSCTIDACLSINKAIRQLNDSSVGTYEAYNIYQPHMQNTQVLYSLLRYRPELWCNSFLAYLGSVS